MTINNVIDMLRAENRDEVPEKLVAFWCSEVDMSLREMLGDGNFAGYSYPEDGDVDLRIPSPWDTAYFFYCAARLELNFRNYSDYENLRAVFDDLYWKYRAQWRRQECPETTDSITLN